MASRTNVFKCFHRDIKIQYVTNIRIFDCRVLIGVVDWLAHVVGDWILGGLKRIGIVRRVDVIGRFNVHAKRMNRLLDGLIIPSMVLIGTFYVSAKSKNKMTYTIYYLQWIS